jgi:hypothetical protein
VLLLDPAPVAFTGASEAALSIVLVADTASTSRVLKKSVA